MSNNRFKKLCDAYVAMAKFYRPAAPGDGVGGIFLEREELDDPARLQREAAEYVRRFIKEEDTGDFNIGCCDYSNTSAFVHTIEAARLLCSGVGFHEPAKKLLRMALKEVGK